MQVVPEKYFVGTGDRIKTVPGIFISVDVRKYNTTAERNFNLAIMNGVAFNQLAVFFDFVNDIVKVVARLLKGIFARFDFVADLKPEVLGIYFLDLIKYPILDLKNNETDILTE